VCSGQICHMLCLNKSVLVAANESIQPCVACCCQELWCHRLRCKILGISNCNVILKVPCDTHTHTQARGMVFNAHSYFKHGANDGGPLYSVAK
jgi:hypothetical protein